MKKFFIILFLLITINMWTTNTAHAITPEEARQLYTDLECVITSTSTCEKGVSCIRLIDLAMHHNPSWDAECINDGGCYSVIIPECGVPIQGIDSCGNACEISGSVCVEPDCVATWCNLPMQSCDLPPLTGGVDSCGDPCSKPSEKWPNCNED